MSDTIAALSSPAGESAIAAIRLSGSLCASLAQEIFKLKLPATHRNMAHGSYHSKNGEILDDAMFCFFQAPASYTGEDMLEIFCHGNPFIIQNILEDLFARSCRLAHHGEFTRRAFENQKLDLSQAEAVSLMIEARSKRSLDAARKQLDGELSKRINIICDKLVNALAIIEAHIDFADEDLPPDSYNEPLNLLRSSFDMAAKLASTSRYGALVRDGLNVSIIGEPNVGKSSLLNALLGRDRAIVSEIAGTTRDFIVERAIIGEHSVNLTDTAGLRDTADIIEKEGVRRALQNAENADLKLLVLDASDASLKGLDLSAKYLDKSNTIIVLNKSDISANPDIGKLAGFKIIEISCLNETGLDALKQAITDTVDEFKIRSSFDDILVSARHATLISQAVDAIFLALEKIEKSFSAELIAGDVRDALESVGEIVGRTDKEEVIDKIFSTFCIGK